MKELVLSMLWVWMGAPEMANPARIPDSLQLDVGFLRKKIMC
jgi:hypothetical protein